MEQQNEIYFMQYALELAEKAFRENEVPVGAVVVSEEKKILGSGYNQIELQKSQLAHAESIAIQQAVEVKKDWRLDHCTLFVTIEPCMMCFGLAHLSRIQTIVFGAFSPLFGVTHLFKDTSYANHHCNIKNGLFQEEAALLLKTFFQNKR